jgi:hypothetical protein
MDPQQSSCVMLLGNSSLTFACAIVIVKVQQHNDVDINMHALQLQDCQVSKLLLLLVLSSSDGSSANSTHARKRRDFESSIT